jgi:hypothetical protein
MCIAHQSLSEAGQYRKEEVPYWLALAARLRFNAGPRNRPRRGRSVTVARQGEK